MKIVFVPIRYSGGSEETLPDLNDEDMTYLHDTIFQQNPLQDIEYEIHDPVNHNQKLQSLGDLLPVMSQLKASENAPADTYYHALVYVGSPAVPEAGSVQPGGVAGIAQLTGDSPGEGNSRVAASVWYSIIGTSRTANHEIGHNQGLAHVECPTAESAGPDPSYPYEDGRIGSEGFGIINFGLWMPYSTYDYMSYCGPTWVSDWTWNKTYQRIKTVTSWSSSRSGPEEQAKPFVPILHGLLSPNGSETWWVVPGTVDPDELSANSRLRFWSQDGQLEGETYARERVLSDDRTRWVSAPLPASGGAFSRIEHLDSMGEKLRTRSIAAESVQGLAPR